MGSKNWKDSQQLLFCAIHAFLLIWLNVGHFIIDILRCLMIIFIDVLYLARQIAVLLLFPIQCYRMGIVSHSPSCHTVLLLNL